MIKIGKRISIIVGACVVVIAFLVVKLDVFSWVFYPTKSSTHKLSIVGYDVVNPNKPVIILKQYVNGINVCDYTLTIKNGVHIQEPQSYELPELDNGTIEVTVELGDEMNSSFTLTYDDAKAFYQSGLLIYFDLADHYHNSAQFVCLVSGKETTCYNKVADSNEFTIDTEFPSLKTMPAKENPGFVSIYSGWKENEWIVEHINS